MGSGCVRRTPRRGSIAWRGRSAARSPWRAMWRNRWHRAYGRRGSRRANGSSATSRTRSSGRPRETRQRRLEAELRERMDAPDLEDDIAGRSVADIVADICRDLGIAASPGSHPWKRRTPGDLTELFARAAGVGASISGAGVGLAGVPGSVRPSTGGMRAVVPGGRTGSDPPPERVGGSPLFDTRFGVWTPHPDPLPQGERESDPGTCTLGEGWRS